MQQALLDFGIRIQPRVTGVFDVDTEWAVREFQIYAKCTTVATITNPAAARYVDRLSGVRNAYFAGLNDPVSGVVDSGTRARIEAWIRERYRCPVVIDALGKDAGGSFTVVRGENLWARGDYPNSNARMFARDFSGTYTLPPGRRSEDPIQLGDFARYGGQSGPRSDRLGFGDQWPEAEITLNNLFGTAQGLRAETLSSFRVMRAVSEVESRGFFDSINAYDNVFISQGPFHQPIGEANDRSGGELCGILSEYEAHGSYDFLLAFGQYGIQATKKWGRNGSDLLVGQRRYATTMSFEIEGKMFEPRLDANSLNYLRSWHWFYRWMMAGRTVQGYRMAFWRGARQRLRALLSTEGAAFPKIAGAAGRIGDIYTSERSVALILRWHVRMPAHMAANGRIGAHLAAAFERARFGGKKPKDWGPPAGWTNGHEGALVQALMDQVPAVGRPGLTDTMRTVRRDPTLLADRGSFQLDSQDLGLPGEVEEEDPGPMQTKCVFRGSNNVEVDEATLRNAIAAAAKSERAAWLSGGALQKEDKDDLFPQLVRYWLAGKDSALPPDVLQLLQSAAVTAPPKTYSNVLDATINKAIQDFNAADGIFELAVDDVYKKSDIVDAATRDLVPLEVAAAKAKTTADGSAKVLATAKEVVADARNQANLDAAKKAESAAQQDHDINVAALDAAIATRDDARKMLTKKKAEIARPNTAVATPKRESSDKEAAASNWSAADRKKVRKDLIKRASTAAIGIDSFIDAALLSAHNSRADVEPWSAAFVSSCVRAAAIDLKLEVMSGGVHRGKDILLKASQKHAEYIIDARDKPAPGRYQAFKPENRAVAVGDIVCADRKSFIEVTDRRQTLSGLTTGTLLHGDIVVEVQKTGSNPYVETIGGNVGQTVRKRRYPLDSSGKLIVSETVLVDQEEDSGKFHWPVAKLTHKPSMVHRQSTFRIFALLSPVGICGVPAAKSDTTSDYAPPSWLNVHHSSRSSDSGQSLDVTLSANEGWRFPEISEDDRAPNSRDGGDACPWWLPQDRSADYFSYAQPQTWGSARLLINGRSSGGSGPNHDCSEPFDSMQFAVESTNPGDAVYLASWMFDPETKLTKKSATAKTWGDLIAAKARNGVTFRLLLNDFPPLIKWGSNFKALDALVLNLPPDRRDNVKYVLSRHPAHISLSTPEAAILSTLTGLSVPAGDQHVAVHHQKFMVVRHADQLTAFCGGVDIIPGMTPWKWSTTPWHGWHDLQVQLEGPITRDVEKEFVARWNWERGASRRPPLPDWSPHERLALTPLSKTEQIPGVYRTAVQMLRTVSESKGDKISDFASTRRDDVRQAYQHGIACAEQFLYMENQYFRVPELGDWIVARGRERPGLIVIIVVVHGALAEADDGKSALTDHGFFLQHETFDRLVKGLGADRVRFYEMNKRYVHSKLILVDDRWWCIGSANVNPRGFGLDSELNVQFREPNPDVLTGFRKRLWAHNLGVSESEAGGWSVSDFIAQWDKVAAANARKGRDAMAGEGILKFDYKKFPGKKLLVDVGLLADLGIQGGSSRPEQLALTKRSALDSTKNADSDFSIESDEAAFEDSVDEGESPMNSDNDAEYFLNRAELALRSSGGDRRESETSFLQRLLRELGGQAFAPELSPAGLFREAVRDGSLMQSSQDLLRVVAFPSKRPKDALQAGDWMLRVVRGTGDVGHVSVLASDDLLTRSMLASEGIDAESAPPGFYGLVIEGGAFPHTRSRPFARRLLDSRGRVPPHTVFLRPKCPQVGVMTDFPSEEPAIDEQVAVPVPSTQTWVDRDANGLLFIPQSGVTEVGLTDANGAAFVGVVGPNRLQTLVLATIGSLITAQRPGAHALLHVERVKLAPYARGGAPPGFDRLDVTLTGARSGRLWTNGAQLLAVRGAGFEPIDPARLAPTVASELDERARIDLHAGSMWIWMSFSLADEAVDTPRWVPPGHSRVDVDTHTRAIEAEILNLPAGALRQQADAYKNIIVAVATHEGSFGTISAAFDTHASLGIFQWAMEKNQTAESGSLGAFFRALRDRAAAAAAPPTPEDRLYVDAWGECTAAGLTLDGNRIRINGVVANGQTVEARMRPRMATGHLRTYQLVGAVDWIEAFRTTVIRPGPSVGRRLVGNSYTQTDGRGLRATLTRAGSRFELEALDHVTIGQILTSTKALASAVTLGVNRPHFVEAAGWKVLSGNFGSAEMRQHLDQLIAVLRSGGKPLPARVTQATIDAAPQQATLWWTLLRRALWPSNLPALADEWRTVADFRRNALKFYGPADARRFHRERRFSTLEIMTW
ncbi:MAG: DUF2272 domain-containing protein [Pyrinomonadaceae bacterium]